MIRRIGYRVGPDGRRRVVIENLGPAPAGVATSVGGSIAVGVPSVAADRRRERDAEYQRNKRARQRATVGGGA
jgi:hypothetical protein